VGRPGSEPPGTRPTRGGRRAVKLPSTPQQGSTRSLSPRNDHPPITRGFGSESCLRNWLTQADVDENGSATELTSKEKKELVELRRDKRRLEMEVEILKRAAAYFARENVLPN